MKKFAFTLAEVLITLTIIGVIAAITIPNLYIKYQKHVWATQLHKCYNRIVAANNVIERDLNDTGYPGYRMSNEEYGARRQIMKEAFASGSGGEFCKEGKYTAITCKYTKYSSNKIKTLNGIDSNTEYIARDGSFLAEQQIFTYPDGSVIAFMITAPWAYWWSITPDIYSITVDVNGGKGPNQVGRDIFVFRKPNNSYNIVPYNMKDTSDCTTAGQGTSCAAKIMQDGWAMKY